MQRKDLALAVMVTAIWGLNFSFIKLGLTHIDPFVLAGLRFGLTALPLVLWIPRPAIPWPWLALYGLSFGVGTWGLVTLSLHFGLSPGLAAWMLQASAFLTPLLAALWLGESMSPNQRRGGVLALFGLITVTVATGGFTTVIGIVLALAGATALSVSNVVVRHVRPGNLLGFMVWSSLFAPLPLFAMAASTSGLTVFTRLPEHIDTMAIVSLGFQVYPTTLLGYWIWNRLIVRHAVTAVAPIALLVPVFATVFAMIIFGTQPTRGQWMGIALILAGLLLAQMKQSSQHAIACKPD